MIRTVRTWLAKPSRTTHQSIGQALIYAAIDGALAAVRKMKAARELDARFSALESRINERLYALEVNADINTALTNARVDAANRSASPDIEAAAKAFERRMAARREANARSGAERLQEPPQAR